MSFLNRAKREDLRRIAEELGENVPQELKNLEIKKLIVGSKNFDEEFVKDQLVIFKEEREERIRQEEREDRIKKEEREERIKKEEREERIKQEERDVRIKQEERERQDRIKKEEREERIKQEERKKQEEREDRIRKEEREDRLKKEEREFEMERFKLDTQTKIQASPQIAKIELRHVVPKFDEKESDISIFLNTFEKQAEWAQIDKSNWVHHLLAFLPPDIIQLIMREADDDAREYDHVKKLLLKKF